MDEEKRAAFIELVKEMPADIRELCSTAFKMGHEEGWWLSRTDPDVTASPVDHAVAVDPFKD